MFPISRTLDRARRHFAGRTAVVDGDRRLTYAALADRVHKLAAALRGLGLEAGDRVAVFRNGDEVSVVSNACQHQNGPLGEGRIIDGLIVCPWHGYQYQPRCGRSPEPFTEKIPTFRAQVRDGRIWVHPTPLPAGTDVEPARIGGEA